MIATHNIKVNGRWVAAGEEYEPEIPVNEEPAEMLETAEAVEEPAEEKSAEEEKPAPKPASARRKKTTGK